MSRGTRHLRFVFRKHAPSHSSINQGPTEKRSSNLRLPDKERTRPIIFHDRQEMGQITLEDVADLRPPTYMNQTTDLQTFRCTDNREFTKQDNPDKYATAVHDLWTQVKKCGQTMKRGNTTDLIKSTTPTEATPLPHTRTPERPTPTPRRLFKKKA